MSPTGTFLRRFSVPILAESKLVAAGFRLGAQGTHTSRTLMLKEIGDLLTASPRAVERKEFAAAIIDDNVLGKNTASNRRLTNQRLGELYGLDARIPIFRVFQRAWAADPEGRPRAALLCALARDPLLRASADAILGLNVGEELVRSRFVASIQLHSESQLNDAVLDKVARNAASSWTQSGHLEGRVRKHRREVEPTPGAVAFALWLGSVEGRVGNDLLSSFWCAIFDGAAHRLRDAALRAKQLGLIKANVAGEVVHIDPSPMLPPLPSVFLELRHGES